MTPENIARRREALRRFRSNRPLWDTWRGILKRTGDSRVRNFHRYGGRGIRICDEWADDFRAFERWINENLGPRPHGMTLDRINNDWHYEPGNLRWADRRTQKANTDVSLLWRDRFTVIQRLMSMEHIVDSALQSLQETK